MKAKVMDAKDLKIPLNENLYEKIMQQKSDIVDISSTAESAVITFSDAESLKKAEKWINSNNRYTNKKCVVDESSLTLEIDIIYVISYFLQNIL